MYVYVKPPLPSLIYAEKSISIQILTIRELSEGKQPKIPLADASAFKKAVKDIDGRDQDELPF